MERTRHCYLIGSYEFSFDHRLRFLDKQSTVCFEEVKEDYIEVTHVVEEEFLDELSEYYNAGDSEEFEKNVQEYIQIRIELDPWLSVDLLDVTTTIVTEDIKLDTKEEENDLGSREIWR